MNSIRGGSCLIRRLLGLVSVTFCFGGGVVWYAWPATVLDAICYLVDAGRRARNAASGCITRAGA